MAHEIAHELSHWASLPHPRHMTMMGPPQSSFWACGGVYTRSQDDVELCRGIFLHRRRDGAVQIERHADRGMPEPLLCDLGMPRFAVSVSDGSVRPIADRNASTGAVSSSPIPAID